MWDPPALSRDYFARITPDLMVVNGFFECGVFAARSEYHRRESRQIAAAL